MSRTIKVLFGMAVILPHLLAAQSHTEKITKELQFEKKTDSNAIMIFNINGDVKIEGYAGDKILVEVTKTIRAKTDARLETGKTEIQLGVIDRADTLILYVQGLCSEFGNAKRKGNRQTRYGGWGYNWNDCNGRDCDKNYDYEMNFSVKVPAGIHVLASTVNDGDVEVQNVSGYVLADNVNGSIRLKNIAGATNASTINGDVDLDYSKNPGAECRYYTLNGDINANFVKGLAANIGFESFNGDLYTNVSQLESLPLKLEKKETGKGIRYKLAGSQFKIGTGGVFLDFETFNGNVYLKEK